MTHRVVATAVRVSAVTLALAAGVTNQSRAQGQIAIGQVVQNQLTAASPVNAEGRRYAMWTFMGNAGQSVQIDMQSSTIDSYLILQDQNGQQLSFNDDGGGGLNARIQYTLPYAGIYRLMAMSYGTSGNVFGTYNLQLAGGAQMGQQMGQPMIQTMANPSGVVGTIGIGQQASGTLGMGDARYDNKPFQAYNFQCTAGLSFQLNIQSSWDNYALVFDPMGNVVARDDDTGEGLNAQVNYTCPMNGTYRLAVSVYSATTTAGPYTMQVMGTSGPSMQQMGQPMIQPMANASGVVGTIGVGQQAQNTLSMGDARFENKPFQAYNFQCTTGLSFQLNIQSSWDNYALIFDPMGNVVARDDDSGEGLNAQVNYTCPMNGIYRLAVSVYSATTTAGPYTMQVMGTAGPTMMQPTMQPTVQPMGAGGMIAPAGQMATIAYGQQLQGRLEPGDRQMQDSTFADIWMFQGTAGQAITIDLTSDNFDSYLQLLDASGNRLGEDDDSGGSLNARISFTIPANAQYQIVVNNYGSSRRAGVYTLWVH
jgi:hypothetical protein